MDTSDTSSVLWAIVENDPLIYENTCCGTKGDLYSKTCHSITLKCRARVLELVPKNGKNTFIDFKGVCECEAVVRPAELM